MSTCESSRGCDRSARPSALVEDLARLSPDKRAEVVEKLSVTEALDVLYTWRLWARAEQVPPQGDWLIWLILAGRGWGKTRTGAEWVHERVSAGVRRLALVARTAADIRDVMVEGESGILATAHPANRPVYNPTTRRLTWPNGAVATTFSAEEPNSLRGPQFDAAWCDELAAWSYAQEAWDQLQFGLRLGKHPRVCITTTPRPTPIIRGLVDDSRQGGSVVVTKGSTFDNAANLAPSFLEQLIRKYEGTRLGRQEISAEILDDNPGALWKRDDIERSRVRVAPEMRRIVVAVDPAASENAQACECGIVVAGVGKDGHGYILEDLSLVASPNEWGAIVEQAYRRHKADRVVAEQNMGGALVEMLLRTINRNIPYTRVTAARGKQIRAEPVAALYEQGRVHHVGEWPELEDQLVTWDPAMVEPRRHRAAVRETEAKGPMQGARGKGARSSDRLDALVWALTFLMVENVPDAASVLPRAFQTKFTDYGGDNPFAPTGALKR